MLEDLWETIKEELLDAPILFILIFGVVFVCLAAVFVQ